MRFLMKKNADKRFSDFGFECRFDDFFYSHAFKRSLMPLSTKKTARQALPRCGRGHRFWEVFLLRDLKIGRRFLRYFPLSFDAFAWRRILAFERALDDSRLIF